MPLTGNVSTDIRTEMHAGKPQKQAVAIAMNVGGKSHRSKRRARQKAKAQPMPMMQHYATGGQVSTQGGTSASGESPNTMALIIIDEFSKRGLDGYFAAQVASAETSGFTNFTGDGGHSHGPFQLYDGGLLSDFKAQGYTDPYDVRQSASYAADYVARTHDWGPWHAARTMFANGQRPSDGSHYSDGTVSYPGGQGTPAPVSSNTGQPGDTGQNPTYTVSSGDSLSAIASRYPGVTVGMLVYANAGNYPSLASNPNLINPGWQLIIPLHSGAPAPGPTGDVSTSVNGIPTHSTYDPNNPPGLPVAGVNQGDTMVGKTVTIPGLGTGTLEINSGGQIMFHHGDTRVALNNLPGQDATSPYLEVQGSDGQNVTIDKATGIVFTAGKANNAGPTGAVTDGSASDPTKGTASNPSVSSSTSYSTSDVGPVQAALDKQKNDITLHLGDVQNQINQLQVSGTLANDSRITDLNAQKFQYQQQLDHVDYQLKLLDLAVSVRAQDATLRGQDISVLMNQLDAQIQGRGQDVTARGQNLDAQISGLNEQLQFYSQLRQDAIDRGDLQGKQDAENRMRATMVAQNELTQRAQDIAIRDQNITAATQYGQLLEDQYKNQIAVAVHLDDFALQKHSEERLSATQQQNAALDTYGKQLEASQQGISAQQGAATSYGNLAQLEQQNNQFLSDKLANPRDLPQYWAALGKGQQFMDSLLSGHPYAGMTIGNIGDTPLVSSPYAEQAQPAHTAFDQAMAATKAIQDAAHNIPTAPSMADILALGQVSPIGLPAEMPTAPTLPNPTNEPTPAPIQWPDIPPVTPIPGQVQTPATFTQADATAEINQKIAAARATGTMPTPAQIRQWTMDASAKIGSVDYSHFNPSEPPVNPVNTNITLPPAPSDTLTTAPDNFPAQVPSTPGGIAPPSTVGTLPTGDVSTGPSGPYSDWAANGGTDPMYTNGNGPPAPGAHTAPPAAATPAPTPTIPSGEAPGLPVTLPTGTPTANVSPNAADQASIDLMNKNTPGWYDQWNTQRTQRGGRKRVVPYAQGGNTQLITEPTTAYGDITGQPKFTLGEQTKGFQQGIPETATVSPDAQSVDIQPYGQDQQSAIDALLADTQTKMKGAKSEEEMRAIGQAHVAAFNAILQNSHDASRAQFAATPPSNYASLIASLIAGSSNPAQGAQKLRKTLQGVTK